MTKGSCINSWGSGGCSEPLSRFRAVAWWGPRGKASGSPWDLVMVQPLKWHRILKITQNLPYTYLYLIPYLGKIYILILCCKSNDEIWVSCSTIYVHLLMLICSRSQFCFTSVFLPMIFCSSLGISFDHLKSKKEAVRRDFSAYSSFVFSI